jgi:hypothetical protein
MTNSRTQTTGRRRTTATMSLRGAVGFGLGGMIAFVAVFSVMLWQTHNAFLQRRFPGLPEPSILESYHTMGSSLFTWQGAIFVAHYQRSPEFLIPFLIEGVIVAAALGLRWQALTGFGVGFSVLEAAVPISWHENPYSSLGLVLGYALAGGTGTAFISLRPRLVLAGVAAFGMGPIAASVFCHPLQSARFMPHEVTCVPLQAVADLLPLYGPALVAHAIDGALLGAAVGYMGKAGTDRPPSG